MKVRYVNLPRISKDNLEMLWADSKQGCWYRNRETIEGEWNEWYKIPTRTYNALCLALDVETIKLEK